MGALPPAPPFFVRRLGVGARWRKRSVPDPNRPESSLDALCKGRSSHPGWGLTGVASSCSTTPTNRRSPLQPLHAHGPGKLGEGERRPGGIMANFARGSAVLPGRDESPEDQRVPLLVVSLARLRDSQAQDTLSQVGATLRLGDREAGYLPRPVRDPHDRAGNCELGEGALVAQIDQPARRAPRHACGLTPWHPEQKSRERSNCALARAHW